MLYQGGIWSKNTAETEGFSSEYTEFQVYSGRGKGFLYH